MNCFGQGMELNDTRRKRACPSAISLADGPDRLSALPDCLLHTIMSFMKARQAVQTCVLSMRWRHLWRAVPCLDIDFDEFKTPVLTASDDSDTRVTNSDSNSDSDSDSDSDSGNDKEWEDFEGFAVNLTFRRSLAVLDSFRLHAGRGRVPWCAGRQAGRWIRHAMKYYYAPDSVIQREGLSSGSWRLKRLGLGNVVLDDRFAKHVSSVCHSLEDLELENCTCKNIHSITSCSLKNMVLKNCSLGKVCEITSPTLKTLVVDGSWNRNSCLVILAPAVAYLHLAVNVYYFKGGIAINEMPSLARALIHLSGANPAYESKLIIDQVKLLCSLSNVKSLELEGFRTMVLGEESTPFPEFKNLRNLLLENCDLTDDFQTLGLFLQNSPNLEKLTLCRCKFLNYSKKKKGTPNPKRPASSQWQSLDVQCENLKLTEIICDGADVCPLLELLLHLSGKVPNNYIKLTKAKSCYY